MSPHSCGARHTPHPTGGLHGAHLDAAEVDLVTSGKGVGVAVVDSGIVDLPDFDTRMHAVYDFTLGQSGNKSESLDPYGHGTHIAGLIGSVSKQGNGKFYQGLAPGADLFGLRVLDGTGSGVTSDVVRALQFAVESRTRLGIDVINLSLGHPIFEPAATDPLVQAVEAAVRAGIVVVVSAGNYGVNPETKVAGYAGVTSPGNAPSAITVGAFDSFDTAARTDDRMAPYSSRGPTWYDGYVKPDLVAPGHAMISNQGSSSALMTAYPTYVTSINREKFLKLSGTSMAAAVATGAAALVIEASRLANPRGPAITPNAVKAILQYTATVLRDDTGAPCDVLTQGAGGVNPAGAVGLASSINTGTPLGSPWLASSPVTYTSFGAVAEPWAQNIVWSGNIVWGN